MPARKAFYFVRSFLAKSKFGVKYWCNISYKAPQEKRWYPERLRRSFWKFVSISWQFYHFSLIISDRFSLFVFDRRQKTCNNALLGCVSHKHPRPAWTRHGVGGRGNNLGHGPREGEENWALRSSGNSRVCRKIQRWMSIGWCVCREEFPYRRHLARKVVQSFFQALLSHVSHLGDFFPKTTRDTVILDDVEGCCRVMHWFLAADLDSKRKRAIFDFMSKIGQFLTYFILMIKMQWHYSVVTKILQGAPATNP